MGQDKSLLVYHGNTQIEYAHDLLSPFCERIFVSTRVEQSREPGYAHFPQINDLPEFSGQGPLAGIASALFTHPHAAWLVLASDLPFVTEATLKALIGGRNTAKAATAFVSSQNNLPEPLCAIWEPVILEHVKRFMGDGIQCPRKVLIKSDTELVVQKDPRWLDNINKPEEYAEALQMVKKRVYLQ